MAVHVGIPWCFRCKIRKSWGAFNKKHKRKENKTCKKCCHKYYKDLKNTNRASRELGAVKTAYKDISNTIDTITNSHSTNDK